MARSYLGVKDTGSELDSLVDFAEVGTHVALSAMTVSPETTAESGYVRILIAGTAYQIPIYAE